MRKFFVALLVGAVAVGLAAPAFAAELKFTGAYRVRAQFDQGLSCLDATPPATGQIPECDGNYFDTRFRPRFEVETEGGVRGVIWLEIGDIIFGSSAVSPSGGAIGADGINVETKNAYIDFPVPATPLRLRAGIQLLRTSKDLILENDGTGLSLYGKLGEVNANLWWLRANVDAEASGAVTADSSGINARDLTGLDLDFSPMKDLNLRLYGIYEHDDTTAGALSTGAATGYWIGAAGRGAVQNIRWDLDFVYGSKELIITGVGDAKRKGWMVDGGVGMALPGTPLDLEVRGWYATGDKRNGGDDERFPVVSSPDHNPGTEIWTGAGTIDIDEPANNAQNTWAFGLIARWTVSPALKVTGNVFYIGTVEEGSATSGSPVADGGGATGGIANSTLAGLDSVGTEVSVKIDYTLARGLVATLIGGRLFLGDDTGLTQSGAVVRFDDVTRVAAQVAYSF